MLDTRQRAYDEEVPKADALMSATDLDALTQKRVDFESRINSIEKSNDVAALGTPEEQRTWARLKRIEDYLAMHTRTIRIFPRCARSCVSKGGHVLAALGELQGAALERAALRQGAGSLADRDAKARGAGEAGAHRHAGEHRSIREPGRGDAHAHGPSCRGA